jgi:hypothetical protein
MDWKFTQQSAVLLNCNKARQRMKFRRGRFHKCNTHLFLWLVEARCRCWIQLLPRIAYFASKAQRWVLNRLEKVFWSVIMNEWCVNKKSTNLGGFELRLNSLQSNIHAEPKVNFRQSIATRYITGIQKKT